VRENVRIEAMGANPASLSPVGLWVFTAGRWHLVETFDPTAREFSAMPYPAAAVRMRAYRTSRDLLHADPRLSCELRDPGGSARP
jgi:hypothetical protein